MLLNIGWLTLLISKDCEIKYANQDESERWGYYGSDGFMKGKKEQYKWQKEVQIHMKLFGYYIPSRSIINSNYKRPETGILVNMA